MDPNKSASGPPTDWSGEKSSMGQSPPPPPYHDNPVYPQPGQAYPPQGQVSIPAAGLKTQNKCSSFKADYDICYLFPLNSEI